MVSKAIRPLRTIAARGPATRPTHAAFVLAALLPSIITAWVLWLAPIDDLAADRTAVAARDFTALWSAGQLALDHATSVLADPALFTERLRDCFGPGMPDQIWPYPPPTLLLAALVAQLPLPDAFLVYSGAGLLLLWRMLKSAGMPPLAATTVLLSPAVADNLLIGQNGAWTAACLAGGLMLLETRPRLAGVLLGFLILKPQMALLVPIALLAGGKWRVAGIALGAAIGLAVLSTLCFGLSPWFAYATVSRQAVQAYFEAPWDPASPLRIFASVFIVARSLGASVDIAYAAQMIVTMLCAALVFLAWRRPVIDPWIRCAITLALTCLASPWIHSYDMPSLAVAIVALACVTTPGARPLLLLAWCWPGLLTLVAIPNTLLVLSTASVAAIAWRADRCVAPAPSWNVG